MVLPSQQEGSLRNEPFRVTYRALVEGRRTSYEVCRKYTFSPDQIENDISSVISKYFFQQFFQFLCSIQLFIAIKNNNRYIFANVKYKFKHL